MRSMGHPDYVYRPHTEERKARASALAKRRLGAPEGYSIVYGVHLPDNLAPAYRSVAAGIAAKFGRVEAHNFAKTALQPPRSWTGEELDQAALFAEQGVSTFQIAVRLRRTSNAVLGALHRRKKVKRAAATSHQIVPYSMVKPMLADHFRCSIHAPEVAAAAVCVAPNFGINDVQEIAEWTGINVRLAAKYVSRLRDARLWSNNGPLDMQRYFRGGGEGFQECDMLLVVDALLCLGKVKRTSDDRWYAA